MSRAGRRSELRFCPQSTPSIKVSWWSLPLMRMPAPVTIISDGLVSYLPTAHRLTDDAGADGGAESGLYVEGKFSVDDTVSNSEFGRDPSCIDRPPGSEAAGVTGADVDDVDTDSRALALSGEADNIASVPACDGVFACALKVISEIDSGKGSLLWSSECPCAPSSDPRNPPSLECDHSTGDADGGVTRCKGKGGPSSVMGGPSVS